MKKLRQTIDSNAPICDKTIWFLLALIFEVNNCVRVTAGQMEPQCGPRVRPLLLNVEVSQLEQSNGFVSLQFDRIAAEEVFFLRTVFSLHLRSELAWESRPASQIVTSRQGGGGALNSRPTSDARDLPSSWKQPAGSSELKDRDTRAGGRSWGR